MALPEPEPIAKRQSDQLLSHLQDLISQHDGVIPFDMYMQCVLYTPGLGYYSGGSRKFGEAGDFVTAPEVSSLYSRCLGRQCAELMTVMDSPVIFELGAGSGTMASDILLELQALDTLPEQYRILEVSADLKQRQQQLLKETVPFFYDNIVWLASLPDHEFNGVILANEVVDALPVKRFKKKANGFLEQGVGLKGESLHWVEMPPTDSLLAQLNSIESSLPVSFPEDYCSEINLEAQSWLESITERLAKGAMFVIDYGYPEKEYYHPDRADGTLLCHYRHRAHADPFFLPGLQDITASVNFSLLAECAVKAGLTVSGYTTQAYFLVGCGLDQLAADIAGLDTKQQTLQAQQIRTLTMPGEMGERFKVMALSRGLEAPLSGFAMMDQRIRL